jgi:hypothetical protein
MAKDQLAALDRAATQGVWRIGNGGYAHGAEFEIRTADDDDLYITGIPWGDDQYDPGIPRYNAARANAALIVALVNAYRTGKLVLIDDGAVERVARAMLAHVFPDGDRFQDMAAAWVEDELAEIAVPLATTALSALGVK